jgi:hypothetical protein
VHITFSEFMVAADVVKMRVTGHAKEFALSHELYMTAQTEMAESRIKKQITITSAHMPHIAAKKGLDPRFVNECYVITHTDGFIPVFGFYHLNSFTM